MLSTPHWGRTPSPKPNRPLLQRLRGSSRLRLLIARMFFRSIPHGQRIGLRMERVEGRTFVAALPYRDELIGNPVTGVLHGGPITVLIDQVSGAAASLSVYPPNLVATLDLRLDHLRQAVPGRTIYAQAEAYRITRQIIFVRCVAHQGDPEQPVAIGMSSFMRNGVLVRNPLKLILRLHRRR